MKQLLAAGLVLGGCGNAFGQANHDGLGWAGISLRVQSDSSQWGLEVSYQYLAYRRASHFYLHFGSLHLLYRMGRTPLLISPGYMLGQIDDVGLAHLGQLQIFYLLSLGSWQPQVRFTLDRVWFEASADQGAIPYTRGRIQLSLEPTIAKKIRLMINTEPFVYHNLGWLKEIRSQAGFEWLLSEIFSIKIGYFHRWQGYNSTQINHEHAAMLLISFRFIR
jgi:hypothetical protein